MVGLAGQITAQLHPVEIAAQRLGVGRSTIYGLMASGELRSVKVGRRRLVSEQAIIDYVAEIGA